MLKTKKGQASLEQLIILGIALTFVAAAFYIAISMSSDNIRAVQANDMVNKLSTSADYVYSMGAGSRETVSIYVPEGVVHTDIDNNTVKVRISQTSGESDIYEDAKPALIGSIPTTPGHHEVLVTHMESGKVMFGKNMLYCSPVALTKSFIQGQNGTDSIFIKNVGDFVLENISARVEGDVTDLMTLSQPASMLNQLESTNSGLNFTVAPEKKPGSYSGLVTVTADVVGNNMTSTAECSSLVTVFVISSTPPDTEGPPVIFIGHSPRNPSVYSTVTIRATADDETTGDSIIETCQVELDGSGIWNEMIPTDGAYDDSREGVKYTFSPLGEGDHYVMVRCMDEYFNIGPERQENFTVKYYIKEILFVTMDSTPNSYEQLWIDWITAHSSEEGFAWNYDIVTRDDVKSGAVNPEDYQVVAMADYPNSDATLNSKLTDYRATAHYVLLLGNAMKFGVPALGVGSGNSGAHSRNDLRVQTNHYITDGYNILQVYTITASDYDIYYHASFEAMNVLSMSTADGRIVVGDSSFVLTYGPTRPDMFVTDGEVFATRVIDHALLES